MTTAPFLPLAEGESGPTPLNQVNLDPVEGNVYVDDFTARKLLRRAGWEWEIYDGPTPACFLDENGEPLEHTPTFIQAVAPNGLVDTSVFTRKRLLLTDPLDRNSDFVTGEELILVITEHEDTRFEVPSWVKKQTGAMLKELAEGKIPPLDSVDHNHTGVVPYLPVRCRWLKDSGERCWNWSANTKNGRPYCKTHGGQLMDASVLNRRVMTARERAMQAAPSAIDVAEELMLTAASEPVRLKAATEILDRAGVRGGIEIDASVTVEQVDPAALVRERLERLAGRLAESALGSAAPAPPGVEPTSSALALETAGETVPGELVE